MTHEPNATDPAGEPAHGYLLVHHRAPSSDIRSQLQRRFVFLTPVDFPHSGAGHCYLASNLSSLSGGAPSPAGLLEHLAAFGEDDLPDLLCEPLLGSLTSLAAALSTALAVPTAVVYRQRATRQQALVTFGDGAIAALHFDLATRGTRWTVAQGRVDVEAGLGWGLPNEIDAFLGRESGGLPDLRIPSRVGPAPVERGEGLFTPSIWGGTRIFFLVVCGIVVVLDSRCNRIDTELVGGSYLAAQLGVGALLAVAAAGLWWWNRSTATPKP